MEVPITPSAPKSLEPMHIVDTETPGWEKLGELAQEGVDQQVYPGCVLIVGHPGEIVWAKAYGNLTYEPDAAPMTMDSMFDLASVTKIVATTSAALALMDDGRISPYGRVADYVPGFEQNGKGDVEIRDLMTHTSGLKPYESRDKVEETRIKGESHANALIRTYCGYTPAYTLHMDCRYSCLNFQTTARVVENVAGMRMEDYLKERVYGPLGMQDSVYTLSDEQRSRCVPTLKMNDGSIFVGETHDPLANYHGIKEHCPGNAGLFGSAPDAARLCEMVLNEGEVDGVRVYKPETIRRATSHQTPAEVNNMRGLGWAIYENLPYTTPLNMEPDRYVIGHTGYTGTFLWLDKWTKTYIVFYTNRVYPDDKSQPEGHLNIGMLRGQLAEAVLRQMPQYQDFFADHDAHPDEDAKP